LEGVILAVENCTVEVHTVITAVTTAATTSAVRGSAASLVAHVVCVEGCSVVYDFDDAARNRSGVSWV